jgi:5-methylcytosine-specific restriction endonuclease McrA
MSSQKKLVRASFREAVFKRDGHKCRVCGLFEEKIIFDNGKLDAHHITDRNEMPNGGYVKENGISLCPECHEKAEVFHSTGESVTGFSPAELYTLIESSLELAIDASKRL